MNTLRIQGGRPDWLDKLLNNEKHKKKTAAAAAAAAAAEARNREERELLEAQIRRSAIQRKKEDDEYTANKEAERKAIKAYTTQLRLAHIALHGSHNGPIESSNTERFHG